MTKTTLGRLACVLILSSWIAPSVSAQTDSLMLLSTGAAMPLDAPIDPDLYLIRPGEKLDIVFIGTDLPNLALTVTSEGQVVHHGLGVINLADLTLTQARQKLSERLVKLYKADQIAITIPSIRPVVVRVSGLVNRPGVYRGFTSGRVSDLIDSCRGLASGGSHRTMTFSGGPQTLNVDLDAALFLDDLKSNPCLYAGDHLVVGDYSGQAALVTGEVKEPRAVELVDDENLGQLIALAGGLTSRADLAAAYLQNDSARLLDNSTAIQPGDVIVIPLLPSARSAATVGLFGAVTRPGAYAYRPGFSLGELIDEAGGLIPSGNGERLTVFRNAEADALGRRSSGRYALAVPYGMKAQAVSLEPEDSVFVPVTLGYVKVSGAVVRPGLYPFSKGDQVADCLKLAGGLTSQKADISLYDRISQLTRPATMGSAVSDGDEVMATSQETAR